MTSPNKFPITRQVLAEMARSASKSNIDTSKLTYTEVQQVLTLTSLLEYLRTYQIDLEIELDIEELHVNKDNKLTRP